MSSTEEAEEMRRKALKALRMLLAQRGAKPGVKGWELKRHFGAGYIDVLEVAKVEAAKLGLEVRSVEDEGGRGPDFARYLLVASDSAAEIGGPLSVVDAAALALVIAMSYGGRDALSLKEVEQALTAKLAGWRAEQALAKLSRLGYVEVEGDSVSLGWRTKAEVDVDRLARSLFALRSKGDDRPSP